MAGRLLVTVLKVQPKFPRCSSISNFKHFQKVSKFNTKLDTYTHAKLKLINIQKKTLQCSLVDTCTHPHVNGPLCSFLQLLLNCIFFHHVQ